MNVEPLPSRRPLLDDLLLSDAEDVHGLSLDMRSGRWMRTPPGDERSDEIAFRDERLTLLARSGRQVEVVEWYWHACWRHVLPGAVSR